jgi:3-hydroxybutyryl-CoA dehydrogenase
VHEPHGTDDLAGAVIGVVGAGTMGAGIAQVALEAGHEVVLYDVDEQALDRGIERVRTGLGRRAAKLELDADSIDNWVEGRLGGLRTALTLDAVGSAADVAIEAALEDLELKRTIFGALDQEAPSEAILATNTSALSVADIAASTNRPDHVLGLHFFNPAPLMPLVEVVRAPETDADSVARATALMERWGKTPVVVADAPGFIVNRVNRPFTIEALRMLEAGEAGISDIDEAMRAAGYPMGPFELMDLIGIDVNLAVATAVYGGLGRPDRLRPSPIQTRLVEEGRIGRKTGAGFYAYTDGQPGDPAADLSVAGGGRAYDVVSRIERAIAHEAELALRAEIASAESIDLALKLGAGHPSGPFESGRAHG